MKFSETAQYIGATVKGKHTVIQKRPFKLKLRPGQPGAQEEFDRLLRGGVSGKERYVEWKKISLGADKTEDKKLGQQVRLMAMIRIVPMWSESASCWIWESRFTFVQFGGNENMIQALGAINVILISNPKWNTKHWVYQVLIG